MNGEFQYGGIPGVVINNDPARAAADALAIGRQFGRVVLAPLGTGEDDMPRFGAVVYAVNGVYPIHLLGSSDWKWKTNLVASACGTAGLPSFTWLILGTGYSHTCSLTPLSLRAIPFFAGAVFAGAGDTTLFEAVISGEPWISTNGSIAVGTDVTVGTDPAEGALWTLASHVFQITSTQKQISLVDPVSQTSLWVVNGAVAGNTNAGVLYGAVTIPAGNATVKLYKDVARTVEVASGALVGNLGGVVTLTATGGSGLTGSCTIIAGAVADAQIVLTCAIAAGHITLTQDKYLLGIDRACDYAYPATYGVSVLVSYPKHIRIDGDGAVFRGVCDKHVCFSFARDCVCTGCEAIPATTVHSYGFATDHGSRDCGFRECYCRTPDPTSITCTGFMLEGSENVWCQNCGVENGTGLYDFGIWSCVGAQLLNCWSTGSRVYSYCVSNTDATKPWTPSMNCAIRDCKSTNAVSGGALITLASINTLVDNLSAEGVHSSVVGGYGIQINKGCVRTTVRRGKFTFNRLGGVYIDTTTAPPINTLLTDLETSYNPGGGIRTEASFDARDWVATNNGNDSGAYVGALVASTGANLNIRIRGLQVSDSVTTNTLVMATTGTLDLADGTIANTKAGGGQYCIRNAAAATVKRANLTISGAANSAAYYGSVANSSLINGANVSTVGCPNRDLFAANAYTDQGFIQMNGATAVTIPTPLASARMDVRLTWAQSAGGTPAAEPYVSGFVAGTSVDVKAAPGDTDYYWYHIVQDLI